MTSSPPDAPRPRRCQIRRNFPEQEYGFNLHADRNKGQYVGAIDPGSLADVAGLLAGDRIVAVNGVSISGETHRQVVSRIKENILECTLVVIDEIGDAWYRERRMSVPIQIDHPTVANGQLNASPTSTKEKVQSIDESLKACSEPPPSLRKAIMRPRLCQLVKLHQDVEFGFNLHAERSNGHFIGKIDRESIAERAGLEEGQRIVGINGTLIYPNTPNRDVIQIIRNDPCRTELLLASPEVDQWYKTHGQEYNFEQCEIFEPVVGGPVRAPVIKELVPATENGPVANGGHRFPKTVPFETTKHQASCDQSPKEAPKMVSTPEVGPKATAKHPLANEPNAKPSSRVLPSTPEKNGGLRAPNPQDWMNLTAAELRDRVSRHKKQDPRKQQQLTLLQKYEIIHNL